MFSNVGTRGMDAIAIEGSKMAAATPQRIALAFKDLGLRTTNDSMVITLKVLSPVIANNEIWEALDERIPMTPHPTLDSQVYFC